MAGQHRDIVVVGASAGGVQALQALVSGLPGNLPAAIFIVLHTWPGSESYLASILSRAGSLPAVTAINEQPIERGKIYVAPNDFHLFVDQGRVLVLRGPRENRFRPAINPLFRSAAHAYRNRVIGVVLTGLLDDGAAGLWAIKQCGGVAVVQSDAQFDHMPRAALDNVQVDHHVALATIPQLLNRLVRETVPSEDIPAVPDVVRIHDNAAKMMNASIEKLEEVGHRSVFSCPECNGALWQVEEGNHTTFRCHVGHAYTAEVLGAAQNSTIETALWTALRALNESASFDERLATRSEESGLDVAARIHRNNASHKHAQAKQIEDFLAQLRPAV